MQKMIPYFDSLFKTAKATAEDQIVADARQSNDLLMITAIAASDLTTGPIAFCHVGFTIGGKFVPLQTFATPAGGQITSYVCNLLVYPTMQPAAKWVGATANDLLYLAVSGYYLIDVPDGIPENEPIGAIHKAEVPTL